MRRTPDEIKNGLYWCSKPVDSMDCEECPYYSNKDCVNNMCSDAARLVKQLVADLEDMTARYKIADDCAKKKGEMNEKLYAELTAAKAERDAAVKDLKDALACFACEQFCRNGGGCNGGSRCDGYGFKWRGVTKEG